MNKKTELGMWKLYHVVRHLGKHRQPAALNRAELHWEKHPDDMTLMELAHALRRYRKAFGLSAYELSLVIGLSRRQAASYAPDRLSGEDGRVRVKGRRHVRVSAERSTRVREILTMNPWHVPVDVNAIHAVRIRDCQQRHFLTWQKFGAYAAEIGAPHDKEYWRNLAFCETMPKDKHALWQIGAVIDHIDSKKLEGLAAQL